MPTEKNKMLRGELYNSMDQKLVQERRRARDLCAQINRLEYGDMAAYNVLRAQLFPNADGSFWVEPPFYCDYGYNLYVGKNTFFNFNCVVLDVCKVSIGRNVMLGPNVQIYTATHPMSAAERSVGLEYGKPISIGDDCWIAGSVVISPGVRIGDRCVIGAGSVVTRDIPDDVFAAGNPARVIRAIDT